MNNSFCIDVCFDEIPLKPFLWNKTSTIMDIKVIRVSTKTIEDLLTYDCTIKTNKSILLLSDTKTSIAIRLSKDGKIIKKSFIPYIEEDNIIEFTHNLKIIKLDYITGKKIEYEDKDENNIKNYILESIKKDKNEDKSKYLYYLCFNKINDYSKERLINYIKKDESNECESLYRFLTEN